MILTPISPSELGGALDRFAAGSADRPRAPDVRGNSRDLARSRRRCRGGESGIGARRSPSPADCGIAGIHPDGSRCRFNWDGTALNGATEAYVILHEIAHFMLAPAERRGLVDFGLGPGPDTLDHATAERAAVLALTAREADEAAASLLGILWETRLGQPALASFLDQNWLEGLDRSAAAHFSAVLAGLRRRGVLAIDLQPERRQR